MTVIAFTRSDSDTHARYGATISNTPGEAEMLISKASATLIIVERTFVPESLRGKDVSKALAEKVISDARAAGQRIVPVCPFFKSYAEKRREALSDVIQW